MITPTIPPWISACAPNAWYHGTPGTVTAATTVPLTGLSQAEVDRSSFQVFYNTATEAPTAWYPAPGLGSTATYNTRWFIAANPTGLYSLNLRFTKPDGTGSYPTPIDITRLRVVVTTLPAP